MSSHCSALRLFINDRLKYEKRVGQNKFNSIDDKPFFEKVALEGHPMGFFPLNVLKNEYKRCRIFMIRFLINDIFL